MEKRKLNLVDYNDKIQRDIKGGFEGLKTLFESYFKSKKSSEDWVLDEIDFEKFVNGKPVIMLGCNIKHDISREIHFRENNNKIEPYNFSDFYEKHFKFEYLGHPFSSRCDVLQEVINNLEEVKSNFSENEFATFICSTLLFLENEIKKSNKCNEAENPKLYEKLIYIKNGYIKTYNIIYDSYSHYIPSFVKIDFNKIVISEIENTGAATNDINEILSEPIKKLTECGFYEVLVTKYLEVEKQQSIIATLFRIHLKSTNIKYDIITVGTQYYNFCSEIGLISHLEEIEFKSGLEIAKFLNAFSKSNDKNLTEMKVKSFENNHTNRSNPRSSYYPFSDGSNKKVNTILMKLNLN